MCHEIEVHFPDRVKARGEHAGFEWLVVINPKKGFHCGYVRVLPGHPWHGQDESQIQTDVHGGLTFCAYDTPCSKSGADDGYWVGFDCGHSQDLADFGGTAKPVSYLERECQKLCEQAAAAAKP